MFTAEDLFASARQAGIGNVRSAGEGDAVDDVQPRLVVEPSTAEQLGAALAWASKDKLRTVVRGGGTKLGWGRIPAAADVVVSTRALNQIVAHRYGDLTATFQAGCRLRDVNAALATHRQWLPVDSCFDEATIGGMVATNDSGPLRHRYGTARDLLIGVTLALTDGRIVKAGGHVVKNVAGYDLGRLMSGSFGTLAAIVDATFKLSPLWPTSQTVVADFVDRDRLNAAVQAIRGSQLEPVACELHASFDARATRYQLLVRFATSPEATAAQVEGVRAFVPGASTVVSGPAEEGLWKNQLNAPWNGSGAVARLSWLPANLAQAMNALHRASAENTVELELAARAGLGAGLLRVGGDDATQGRIVDQLRSDPMLGNVTVLRASQGLKRRIDVWPPAGDTQRVLGALKQSLDPAGILNAGRGPI